jgi:hypothetical protein
MFHELDAERGWPSHSAFWVKDLQRLIIRRLAASSSFRLTNTALHLAKLKAWQSGKVDLSASFSTVGEPVTNLPVNKRQRQVIIFGRPSQRSLAYDKGRYALKTACELVGAERIVDIGSPIGWHDDLDCCGVPIVRYGILPAEQVSSLIGSSIASFIYYPNSLLTKSSVYAASSAHGTIPFTSMDQTDKRRKTELVPGKDFVAILSSGATEMIPDLQGFSTELYNRYQLRSSSAACSLIAQLLQDS